MGSVRQKSTNIKKKTKATSTHKTTDPSTADEHNEDLKRLNSLIQNYTRVGSKNKLDNTSIINGILGRIAQRRERLEYIAKQSNLFNNPYSGTHTDGKIVTKDDAAMQKIDLGDLICSNSQEMGVVVKTFIVGFSAKLLVLTLTRSLQIWSRADVGFHIKNFIPETVASDCVVSMTLKKTDQLLEYPNVIVDQTASRNSIADDEFLVLVAPIHVAQQICGPLRKFETEVMAMHSTLLPFRTSIHETLSGDEESRIWHLIDIATRLREPLKVQNRMLNIFYYAVHLMLVRDPIRWQISGSTHYRQLEYAAMSKNSVKQVESAIELLRDINGDASKSFINKCRRLIRYYRRRSMAEARGEKVEEVNVKFSKNDQAFVRLIILRVMLNLTYQEDTVVLSVVGRLLREIDMWDTDVFPAEIAQQLLWEIGVIPRWANMSLYNVLDGRDIADVSQLTYKNDRAATGSHSQLEYEDSMASLRYDFGDMPVYCVDGPEAEEIDDGFSIEPVEDGTWVHVHIANPTALISRDHPIAKEAMSKWETIYLSEASRAMLPREIISASGLKRDEGEDERMPRLALTFSAKLDGNGEIADYAVRSSYIRNIKAVTYGDLSEKMNWKYTTYDYGLPSRYVLPYADKTQVTGCSAGCLTEQDKTILQIGFDTAENIRVGRGKAGGFVNPVQHYSLSVSKAVKTYEGRVEIMPVRARYDFESLDPQLKLFQGMHASQYVIAEFMMLAGRVATRYASERGISLPFRHGSINDGQHPSSDDYRSSGFLKKIYPTAFTAADVWYSAKAGPATDMGIPEGYARVTSPLRRFLDMVAHWQIEASLRGEKQLYAESEMVDMIRGYVRFQERTRSLKRSTGLQWKLEYLEQLYRQGEAELTVVMMSNGMYPEPMMGYCVDYDMMVQVVTDRMEDIKIGEYIVCREVEQIDMLHKRVVVKAPEELTAETRYGFSR